MVDITELAAELTTDPLALGYAAFLDAGNDAAALDLLNDKAGVGAGTIDRKFVDARTFQAAVDATEYLALTQAQRDLWAALLQASAGSIAIESTQIRNQVLAVWAAGTTRSNLAALQTRTGSRAEVLWGDGTVISFLEIATAWRG